MHPAPRKKFDSVGLDKPAFGEAKDLPESGLKLSTKQRKGSLLASYDVKYLRNDPGSRYSTNYTEKNYRDVQMITSKQTNVPTLLWSTSLRGANFNRTSYTSRVSQTCKGISLLRKS